VLVILAIVAADGWDKLDQQDCAEAAPRWRKAA
jgi:hypothetical protein